MKIQVLSILLALFILLTTAGNVQAAGSYLDFDPVTGTVTCSDSSIVHAVIPSSIGGIPVKQIGADGFSACTNLQNLTVSQGVTHIGPRAFHGCSSLISADLPASLAEIGEDAFSDCRNLSAFYYGGTIEMLYKIRFLPGNDDLLMAQMYVAPPSVTDVFTGVHDNWAREGIQYCWDRGIMQGTGENLFSPNLPMTWGMFTMVLWNLMQRPVAEQPSPFRDLSHQYYQDAIAWAYESGVIQGISSVVFAPDRTITREQAAAILYRFANYVLVLDTSSRADLSGFPDGSQVSAYACIPLSWACSQGIIAGSRGGGCVRLLPTGRATRAQAARMLMIFLRDTAEIRNSGDSF